VIIGDYLIDFDIADPHFDADWVRAIWVFGFRVSSQRATVCRKNDSPNLVMIEAIVGGTGAGTISKDVYDVVQTFQEPLLIEVEGLFGGVRGILVREPDHHSTPYLTVFFMRFDLRNLKARFDEVEWRGQVIQESVSDKVELL
jgi:hypothetical protein